MADPTFYLVTWLRKNAKNIPSTVTDDDLLALLEEVAKPMNYPRLLEATWAPDGQNTIFQGFFEYWNEDVVVYGSDRNTTLPSRTYTWDATQGILTFSVPRAERLVWVRGKVYDPWYSLSLLYRQIGDTHSEEVGASVDGLSIQTQQRVVNYETLAKAALAKARPRVLDDVDDMRYNG